MLNKKFNILTEYDMDYDLYSIVIDDEFKFNKSIEIEEGIILDFDENMFPFAIEIIDASRKLKINKQELNNAKVHIKIESNSDIVKILISFYYKINNLKIEKDINSKLANNFNIPSMVTVLATI